MDTVGIPENKAWDVYKVFVIRRLQRRGMPALEAAKQVKERTPLAREEILNEMAERPVFIDRAPVLHRFGIMAFWPRLVKGDVMQVSPLVVGGFNADFDGDAMQYHVPTDEAARQEAIDLMLPSKNLLSPGDFKSPVHKPGQEYVGGLHAATSVPNKRKRPHYFASRKQAIAAYRRGDIDIDTPIEVP
jgi:DNA-directed RNA polymerase subunit beta'